MHEFILKKGDKTIRHPFYRSHPGHWMGLLCVLFLLPRCSPVHVNSKPELSLSSECPAASSSLFLRWADEYLSKDTALSEVNPAGITAAAEMLDCLGHTVPLNETPHLVQTIRRLLLRAREALVHDSPGSARQKSN
ncbi:MAG: hypothetical protein MUP70_03350, partial [Candidatus Aminicenantes bacterium]|nr:hypothetical protein [Candidatus Aminicenantes bacterium]